MSGFVNKYVSLKTTLEKISRLDFGAAKLLDFKPKQIIDRVLCISKYTYYVRPYSRKSAIFRHGDGIC